MTPVLGRAGPGRKPLARAMKSILKRLLEMPMREGMEEKGGPWRKEALLSSENLEVTKVDPVTRLGVHVVQCPQLVL